MLSLPDHLVNNLILPLRRRLLGDTLASPDSVRAHVERRRRRPESPRPPLGMRRKTSVNLVPRDPWPVPVLPTSQGA
jgi:hypothetical protein